MRTGWRSCTPPGWSRSVMCATYSPIPKHPYTRGLLRSVPNIALDDDELYKMEGAPPSLLHPPAGCRFHPRCPTVMEICSRKNPPLKTVGSEDQQAPAGCMRRKVKHDNIRQSTFDARRTGAAGTCHQAFPGAKRIPGHAAQPGSYPGRARRGRHQLHHPAGRSLRPGRRKRLG